MAKPLILQLKEDNETNRTEIEQIKTDQTTQNTRISTNETNITELQGDNETNKENIEKQEERIQALEAENAEQNELIKMQEDILPKTSAEGENVSINNSRKYRFSKFKIGGNDKQETGDVLDDEDNVIGVMPSTDYPSEIHNVGEEGSVDIVINNGKEQTDEDYQSQNITFPLAEGQVLHEGDYLADDGIHQVKNTNILDGTENITFRGENNIKQFEIDLERKAKIINTEVMVISNYFKGVAFSANGVNSWNIDNSITVIFGGNIRIMNSTMTTLEEFKTWLSENPVTVEYELEEEIIIPYTDEQQAVWNNIKKLTSYDGQTNIFSNDEISPIFEVECVIDKDKEQDEKINEIMKAIVALGGVE